jgi:putative hydrolase of the HAD superfamily
MEIKVNARHFFVFDLDDTLFPEIEFLKSAYRHIANELKPVLEEDIYEEMFTRYKSKENVFKWVAALEKAVHKPITTDWLIKEYREHVPLVELNSAAALFLEQVKKLSIPAGLITDGRSITQRNKLKSLGIDNYFRDIIISEEFGSEKPDERNFLFFQNKYPGSEFYFFGDNTVKDFIVPIKLGWSTVCLKDSGNNIHKQAFDAQPLPAAIISSFSEIKLV